MITINGRVFVPRREDINRSHHTGSYRPHEGGILLMGHDGTVFAYVVNNRHGEQFIVTAYPVGSAIRFMFSTCTDTERMLGLENTSPSQVREIARAAIESLNGAIQ